MHVYDKFIYHNGSGGKSLAHHGIKGQRWGIRRYQNEDGSLTEAGKKRYSYEGAKSAKIKSRVGIGVGLGIGALGTAALIKQMHDEQKEKEDWPEIANTKEYKRSQNLHAAGTGILGISGMINGAALNSHYNKQLDDIIKNSPSEEFNKIKKDKMFSDHPIVKDRIHFDNFEKRNKITKNISNHKKADLYAKEIFKKDRPISNDIYGIDDSDAWYNASRARDWYGINDKDFEKMCWKYHNQYSLDKRR